MYSCNDLLGCGVDSLESLAISAFHEFVVDKPVNVAVSITFLTVGFRDECGVRWWLSEIQRRQRAAAGTSLRQYV